MTPAEYYSKEICPFCSHKLAEVIDDQGMLVETICHVKDCETQYIYDVLDDSVTFYLGNYSFAVQRNNNFTSIIEGYSQWENYRYWKEIIVQESIIITRDNYQGYINRFNKLKVFL